MIGFESTRRISRFFPEAIWLALASAAFVTFALGNCSSVNSQSSDSVAEIEVKPAPTSTPVVETVYGRGVDRYSSEHGLDNLSEVVLEQDEFEIRLWVGFSVYFPRALVVSARNGKKTTTHITGMLDNNHKPLINRQLRFLEPEKASILNPNYGVDQLLTDSYAKDPGWRDPDATSVGIEVRRGKIYRVITYPISTKSKDGMKALQYVRDLEVLYGLELLPTKL